jgi:hypothetical protein
LRKSKEPKLSRFSSTTLGYGLDDQGLGIFLFSTASGLALGPTKLPIQLVPWILSLGEKRPRLEADHSLPSSAEVKAWSYTSTPPLRLHVMVLSLKKSTVTTLLLPYLYEYIPRILTFTLFLISEFLFALISPLFIFQTNMKTQ